MWPTAAVTNGASSHCFAPEQTYQEALNLKEGRNGIGKDLSSALKLFEKAAKAGHPNACYQAGIMHYFGQGTKLNRSVAKDWFLRAVNNVPAALHMLGMYYLTLAEEEKQRASNHVAASIGGFGDPELSFGFIKYYSEYDVPVQRNSDAYSLAINYFKKNVDANSSSESAHQLGKICRDEENHEQAVKWFERAYELGHKSKSAMFYCGWVYHEGADVPVDFQKAKEFFLRADDLGHSAAQRYIIKIALNDAEKTQTISTESAKRVDQYEMTQF